MDELPVFDNPIGANVPQRKEAAAESVSRADVEAALASGAVRCNGGVEPRQRCNTRQSRTGCHRQDPRAQVATRHREHYPRGENDHYRPGSFLG